MRKTFVNVVNQDLTPLLSGIKNDTLLIWGDKDTATPLEYAKLMEKKMPNAGLAVLEGAGHFHTRKISAVLRRYEGVFERIGEIFYLWETSLLAAF